MVLAGIATHGRRLVVLGAGVALAVGLGLSAPAASLPLVADTDPIPINISGDAGTLIGQIDFVTGSSDGGPLSGSAVFGSPGPSDAVAAFTIELDGSSTGSVVELSVGAFKPSASFFPSATGGGTDPNGGVDVSDGGLTTSQFFNFGGGGDPDLDPGETSDVFYATWASLLDGSTINFSVDGGGSSAGTVSTTITLVPEPGVAALAGLGLLGLGVLGRRR